MPLMRPIARRPARDCANPPMVRVPLAVEIPRCSLRGSARQGKNEGARFESVSLREGVTMAKIIALTPVQLRRRMGMNSNEGAREEIG